MLSLVLMQSINHQWGFLKCNSSNWQSLQPKILLVHHMQGVGCSIWRNKTLKASRSAVLSEWAFDPLTPHEKANHLQTPKKTVRCGMIIFEGWILPCFASVTNFFPKLRCLWSHFPFLWTVCRLKWEESKMQCRSVQDNGSQMLRF